MESRESKRHGALGAARQEPCKLGGPVSSARAAARMRRGGTGSLWRARAARLFRNEHGQALVLTAMSLTMLMGGMSLAIDIGNIHYQQRKLQTAADSAAIAAGLELGNCVNTVCTNMIVAAEHALIEDGITTATVVPTSNCSPSTSNLTGLAMYINVAPCALGSSDPNSGNANMAEVVLTQPQNTFFGRIFGIQTMNLVAHAEAGEAYIQAKKNGGGNCIWTGGITFNSGDADFVLTDCGVYDNGGLTTNSGDSATATDFLYYGTWSPNNCNSSCQWNLGQSETQPTSTTKQQNDPLANLTPPSQPANSSTYNVGTPTNGSTMQPGYYPYGFNLNSGTTVNLAPGLYYMNGSINVDSGANLECTACTGGVGVTLYFTNGSLQPNSGSTVELSAPSVSGDTTGTILANNAGVQNMLIWTASGNGSGLILDSGSQSYYNGVIYLPAGQLTLNSGSGAEINGSASDTAVDVQSIMVDSGIHFNLNGSQSLLGGGGGTTETLGSFALAE